MNTPIYKKRAIILSVCHKTPLTLSMFVYVQYELCLFVTHIHLNWKIDDWYVIHSNACSFSVFLLFCYFYVKSSVMIALSLSLSLSIFRLFRLRASFSSSRSRSYICVPIVNRRRM